MRRKRLQHVANGLCQIFCGWRLANSYGRIEHLGSGTLHIDVLTIAYTHNGEPIPAFSIAHELTAWMDNELQANSIPRPAIVRAELAVELDVHAIPRRARKTRTVHFEPPGRRLTPFEFIACDITCSSEVATNETIYRGSLTDREEWPTGFVKRRSGSDADMKSLPNKALQRTAQTLAEGAAAERQVPYADAN